MGHQVKFRRSGFFAAVLACCFLLATLVSSSQHAQAKKPISKSGLLEAVKLNGLSTQELIERVQQRGVNFQLTEQDVAEFQAAGARPELIEAVRANYRPEAPPDGGGRPNGGGSPNGGGRSNTRNKVPAGAPLSQNEVVTLLQSGVGSARVEQMVETRGVDFSLTPAITKRIKDAGGSTSLIGMIAERATSSPAADRPNTARSTAPDYDELTDQATSALGANNAAHAVTLLQQAIKLNPAPPTAYALLGYAELYLYRNINAAEMPMRAAVEHGGAAVFLVYHDHDGLFRQYCTGSFFVTKTNMTFKADNGVHTFEANKPDVKEIKLNNLIGKELGAFHVRVAQKNYNFAPKTTNRAEANLIINLFQAYR
jgi:hypothetical protein